VVCLYRFLMHHIGVYYTLLQSKFLETIQRQWIKRRHVTTVVFLSSIFRRELNIHGAWSFCLSTDLDGYSWHLETGYSLRTEHQPFWYLVPPEIPFCIRGSITAANAAGNYVDCKKFVIHSKRRSLSRFVAVWYRFYIYAIQTAVLCGSTTTTTAENCRKPQIYRREDREGTALTAIKA